MKRIFITATLIISLSTILLFKTNEEINGNNNVSHLYSGTLVDMVSPKIAPTYSLSDMYTMKQ